MGMWGGIKAGMDQLRQDEKDRKIADLQTRADKRAEENFKLDQLKFKINTLKDLNLYKSGGSKSDKTDGTVKDVLKLKSRLREGFDTYSEEDQKRITDYENQIVQDPLEASGVLKALTDLGKKGRKFSALELIDTFEIINFVEGTNTEKRAELAETLNVDLSMDEFVKLAELAATYTPPSVTVDYSRADVTPMTVDQMKAQAATFERWLSRESNRVVNSEDTPESTKTTIITLQNELESSNPRLVQNAIDKLNLILFPDVSVFEVVKDQPWATRINENKFILPPLPPVVEKETNTTTKVVPQEAIDLLNNNPTDIIKQQFEKTYGVLAKDYLRGDSYKTMNQSDFLTESQ